MEQITAQAIECISTNISFGYLITFIFLSYGLRDVTAQIMASFIPADIKKLRSYAVFLIATALAPAWYFLFGDNPMKLLITYSVGTSLYELIIQAIIRQLKLKQ